MAHHSDKLPIKMQHAAARENFGPTHEFPDGRLCDEDDGELRFGVAHDPATGRVLINFGRPVAWLGMTPSQALELGGCLVEHGRRARDAGPFAETECVAGEGRSSSRPGGSDKMA